MSATRAPISYKDWEEALFSGNTKEILRGLNQGYNINSDLPRGKSPLCGGAFSNSKEIVELLIMRGAGVNHCDDAGFTPLSYTKNTDCLKLLLDHNANIDQVDQRGYSPLMTAIAEGFLNVVEFLLEQKASLTLKDHQRRDALEVARQKRDELNTGSLLIYGLIHTAVKRHNEAETKKEDNKSSCGPVCSRPF